MLNKLRTTSFWLGLSSAAVLVLDCISSIVGFELYSKEVETVILTICSVLVTIGIVTKKSESEKEVSKEELLEDIDESIKK